jgi:hypothetical protein
MPFSNSWGWSATAQLLINVRSTIVKFGIDVRRAPIALARLQAEQGLWRKYLVGAIGMLLGSVALYSGIWTGLHLLRLERTGLHTSGTVVRIDTVSSPGPESSDAHVPVVRFATADGTTVEFQGSSDIFHHVEVGEGVRVLYLQNNPRSAAIDWGIGKWFAPLFAMSVGFVFVAAALTGKMAKDAES